MQGAQANSGPFKGTKHWTRENQREEGKVADEQAGCEQAKDEQEGKERNRRGGKGTERKESERKGAGRSGGGFYLELNALLFQLDF